MRTRVVSAVAAVACAAAAVVGPAPAQAAAGGASFAVSTPAQPIAPDHDGTVHTVVTVSNNGSEPLTVALRSVGVTPQNDGKVEIVDQPDPAWRSAPLPRLRLAGHEYRRVPVTIKVPKGALPDLYLLGFLAEAVPNATTANVLVYNQIATLVTVEVPGPRARQLAVVMQDDSFLHIGSELDGVFRVRNVGSAAAMARGQLVLDSATGSHNIGVVQASDQPELFPAGTSRTMDYTYEVNGLFLLARPSAQVVYGNGTSTMNTAVYRGHPVLVVPLSSVILLSLALAALLTLLAFMIRHRRKLRRSTGRHHRSARARASAPALS
jgi:hypothetical protein